MEDIVALMIPIVMFIVIGVTVAIALHLKARQRKEAHETIRAAIEHGTPLSPETIAQLTDVRPTNSDLRKGVISIMIALAIGVFAFAVGEDEAERPLLGIASFPFLIGLAYLVLWRFSPDDDRSRSTGNPTI